MKRIKVILWYKIKKYLAKRKIKDLKKATESLNKNQSMIISIANFIMANSNSKLFYSPMTVTYFMEYSDVVCKIDDDRIIITNGLYSYDISIPAIIIYDVRERFVNHLESRKKSVEKRILQKMNSSLGKVYEQIVTMAEPKERNNKYSV
jgi:hypothetical protein